MDIFFTISGYLITGIISRELQDGNFSIAKFYERRMRRILPALWGLLLVCIPVSYWLLLPEQAEPMAKSALWSMLSMANLYFWQEVSTDYFAPESSQMPFLHLWSLGVEEQFYLLWPLILGVIWWRFQRKAWLVASAAAILMLVASTVLAEALFKIGETRFAYYMLPTRAGELTIGAALALSWPACSRRFHLGPRAANTLAPIGWITLIASVIWLGEAQPFPGIRSLLPVGGAVLLIAAGNAACHSPWLRPLRHPLSIWIGRCSYSAYLWHWPILAWWRYLWGQPSDFAGFCLLLLILALAGASQRWLEEPARRTDWGWTRTVAVYLLLPMALLGGMALLVAQGERRNIPLYPTAVKAEWARLSEFVKPAHHVDWVCQQHILDPRSLTDSKCEFGAGEAPASVLLLGDSQAASFAPMIRKLAEAQGVKVRSVALGSCAALPGSLKGVVADWRLGACEQGIPQILKRAEAFPLLILGGAWDFYAKNDPLVWRRLEAYLRQITTRGQRVILLPHVPAVKGYDANCQLKQVRAGNWLQCPATLHRNDMDSATNQNLGKIAQRVAGVSFLSVDSWFCQTALCPVADADGHYFYSDANHISVHGAELLAEAMLIKGAIPELRLSPPGKAPSTN